MSSTVDWGGEKQWKRKKNQGCSLEKGNPSHGEFTGGDIPPDGNPTSMLGCKQEVPTKILPYFNVLDVIQTKILEALEAL